MITILADEGKGSIGFELFQELLLKSVRVEYISLEGVQVKPCVSCGGCTYKTYGRCVTRDDGDWIFPKLIEADVLLVVTPITFGCYSAKIKQVIDKLGLIMDRHYFMKKGEMVKGGMQGKQFKFFVIGIKENSIDAEIEVLKKLHHENIIITRGVGTTFIVDRVLTPETKYKIIKEVQSV